MRFTVHAYFEIVALCKRQNFQKTKYIFPKRYKVEHMYVNKMAFDFDIEFKNAQKYTGCFN